MADCPGGRIGVPPSTPKTPMFVTLIVLAMPIVVLAPVAQLVFGIKLGWFPPTTAIP